MKNDTPLTARIEGSAIERPVTLGPYVTLNVVDRVRSLRPGLILFLLMVGLPTLIGAIYYTFIASDRYVSHASLTVRNMSGGHGGGDFLSSMLGAMAGTGSREEAYIIENFIRSREMAEKLDKLIGVRTIYGTSSADWFSRLESDATDEKLYEHLKGHISVGFDSSTGLIELTVDAYTPADAKAVAEAVLTLSEQLVNRISERAYQDSTSFASNEVARAELRLESSLAALQAFRKEHAQLDPVASASAISGIITGLESELASKRAELNAMRRFMRDDSARVVDLRGRISALEEQVRQERQKIGERGAQTDRAGERRRDPSYSILLTEYERLMTQHTFAQRAYETALTSMEAARLEASRQHLYLVPFVAPSLADEATRPQRILSVLTVLGVSLLAFAVVGLVGAAIREHARF